MPHQKTTRIRTHAGAWIYPVNDTRPLKRARVKLPFEVDAVRHDDVGEQTCVYEFTWKDGQWTIDAADVDVLPVSIVERLAHWIGRKR